MGEISANAKQKTLTKYLIVNIWGLKVLAKTGNIENQSQAKVEVLEKS